MTVNFWHLKVTQPLRGFWVNLVFVSSSPWPHPWKMSENFIFFSLTQAVFTVVLRQGLNSFALNHSIIFCSSKIVLVRRVLTILSEIIKFVSSANNSGSKALEMLFKSLMYKTNSSGPRIDPWGKPYTISWNEVFLSSLIATHCFRFLR